MNQLARSSPPPLDGAHAGRVARSLHRAAVAWAHTFLKSRRGLDPALAETLAAETLAFGLALLEQRLRWHGPSAASFLDQVRRDAWQLHARWRQRAWSFRRLSGRGEAADGPAQDLSEFTLACRARGGATDGSFEFTEPMHAEFCELTGLGTSELVGNGANLAALVFYLIVHGRVFASRPDSREERRWLVQALRECREFLERALEHWLATSTAAARPVSASIGR
jgi:hypothetical protein